MEDKPEVKKKETYVVQLEFDPDTQQTRVTYAIKTDQKGQKGNVVPFAKLAELGRSFEGMPKRFRFFFEKFGPEFVKKIKLTNAE